MLGRKKKRHKGRRRLLECGRSGWGKTAGPAVDFHPPQYGRRYLSKSSLFIFFIQHYSSCVFLSYWLRGLFNVSWRTLPMPGIILYLCRLSTKVPFRSLLCVSFHQCSRGFGTVRSGLLLAHWRGGRLHRIFNICSQMWDIFMSVDE